MPATATIKTEGMSRRDMLGKRAALVAEMRLLRDKAEADEGRLSAEEEQRWENADADIEALSDAIDKTPAIDFKTKMAKWDAEIEKDPGRLSAPTMPNSNPGDTADFLSAFAKDLKFDSEDVQPLRQLASPDYSKAFHRYLKTGERAQSLSMKVGEDAKGGVLAPMQWVAQMIKFVDNLVLIRQKATVFSLGTAVSMGAPSWDTDPGDGDWTPEIPASAITADDSTRVGKRELMPHGFTKLVKMSNKLRRTVPMLESFLIARLGYKAAVTEEKAFMTAAGNERPLGLFTASSQGINTDRDITTAGSLTVVFDDFIDALMSLKQQYWGRASWIMSRYALKVARKLKDTTNQYLWQPAIKDGSPSTILDRPYDLSEYCPGQTAASWTAGTYVAIIGDYSNYWIADSLQQQLRVLEELLALTLETGFLLTKETDGMPVLPEAFARIALHS